MRRLGGDRAGEIRLTRFLRHPAVQPDIMLAEAIAHTAERCRGRAVLALQDTTVLRSTGGGGTYLRCVLALDAESGAILGLIDASFVHRDVGRRAQRRAKPIEEKESFRWLEGADQAATVCARARSLTVIADREGDIYEAFALRPEHSELLVRAAHDRALDEGERLWTTLSRQPVAGWAEIDLPARPGRRARTACLALRHASLSLVRPRHGQRAGLPAQITVNAIEVVEEEPPAGQDALHWRLLTTQPVRDAADALAVVEQYRRRWAIEQLFRTLKTQGFDVENILIADERARQRLTAAALIAAVIVQQLVHARDGHGAGVRPVTDAFAAEDQALLEACSAQLEGKTARQKNPHPRGSLGYGAWVCARLGGWTGYYGKPGPIVMLEGWKEFQARKRGANLRLSISDV
ncbi:Transposase DDE domain-containing protein [Methylobacterium sp. 174MFSha1.1]|uniref:IS4 family transposase n=1 Tax=Methylobacterium sp. 174MFSha1.1 TaxID=1502749 RepID=UPI0008E9488E|nr:IS4 family transposase [Methylobacterium sp. 174MFSha1.1]SFU48239.1 Transposase DDE domain-containing protein [Methylobacterium sp. 174MFSha1.1]